MYHYIKELTIWLRWMYTQGYKIFSEKNVYLRWNLIGRFWKNSPIIRYSQLNKDIQK